MDKNKIRQLADYAINECCDNSDNCYWTISYDELYYHFGAEVSDTNENGKLLEEVQKIIEDAMTFYNNQKEIIGPLIIAVDTLFKLPCEMDLLTSRHSRDVAIAIGEIVKGLVDKDIVESLLITGGDTALHVLYALNTEGIDLQEEVLAGIPLGLLSGGKAHNVRIVTKAGGFGSSTALLEVIKHLKTV